MERDASVAGVLWGRVVPHPDNRGAFREVWRETALPSLSLEDTGEAAARFVQANLSFSKAGVLRGLHYHEKQLDHWVVVGGEVFVALVDLRTPQDQPTVTTRVLHPDETVTIPIKVAHGFLALRATTLLYFVTSEYDGTDERGVAWDDPRIRIAWPPAPTDDGRPILSDRDRGNPPLQSIRR